MDEATIIRRIDELLELFKPEEGVNWSVRGAEIIQGTMSVMIAIHGQDSSKVAILDESIKHARDAFKGSMAGRMQIAAGAARGALLNLKNESDAGLLGSLRKQISSGVLTDFIQLARKVLEESSDDGKNVAAVLTAAVFEDTIRRMGREFAGIMGRDDLEDVIGALKKADVLRSPQLGIALSYLSFRNHALHADWDKIDRAAVQSCLGFVEGLLLKHFG